MSFVMYYHRRNVVLLTIALLVCWLVAPAVSQEDQSPAKAETAKEKAPPPDSPAVAAILETKPATPSECVKAAKILADLDRDDLAKTFLKKTLDANLDAGGLADLGEQVGSPVFLELSRRTGVQPEGRQLADAVGAALAARLHDPERITKLIEQLQDPSPEKRLQALVGLQSSGEAAIPALVAALVDPSREAARANLRAALVEMGRAARDPLLAIAGSSDPKLAVEAIRALAAMKDPGVAIFLYRPALSEKSDPAVRAAAAAALKQLIGGVPSRNEALKTLTGAARNYLDGHYRLENLVVTKKPMLWRCDAKGNYQSIACTPNDLARVAADRLARDSFALAPDDRAIGLLYATAALEAAGSDGNPDFPALEKKWSTANAFNELLEYAMANHRMKAAVMAADFLGRNGKADELLYRGAGPAPLALALQSPDRRLQIAALEAIVRLKPTKLFAGSSYVPRALGFLAGSSGSRHAVVGCPNAAEGAELAGMLSAAGFVADTFTNGRELISQAARSPDCELALIDVTIDRPTIDILLQQLRHDPRTASIRVGLIARDGYLGRAERLAGLDPLSKAFSRPRDDKAFQWQLQQLTAIAPKEFVDFKTRQQQAARALELLAELSESPDKLYDLRGVQDYLFVALYNPKLTAKTAAVLANINTAESQRALVELASRMGQPIFERQAATKAFRKSTQQFGVLLTTAEIRRQYDRYNASEKEDADTQHVLGLILDCLEVRAPKK